MNTILLVEDNDLNFVAFRSVFEKDFLIRRATRLFEAIDFIKCNYFDCIVLDLWLPDSKGEETYRNLKPVTNSPIIIWTADDDFKTLINVLRMGADRYLIKGKHDINVMKNAINRTISLNKFCSTLHEMHDTAFRLKEEAYGARV